MISRKGEGGGHNYGKSQEEDCLVITMVVCGTSVIVKANVSVVTLTKVIRQIADCTTPVVLRDEDDVRDAKLHLMP